MLDGDSEHPSISAAKSPQMLERWHSVLMSGPKCSDPSGIVKHSPSWALQINSSRSDNDVIQPWTMTVSSSQGRGGSGHSTVATSTFPPFGKFYIFKYCHLLANKATNWHASITPVIKAGFGRRWFCFNGKGLDETPHQSYPWALSITIYYSQKWDY